MHDVPPFDCLRFFESAARHESFSRAADELKVTAAAVGYRVKTLEEHLGHPLFERLRRRGVRLTRRGKAYVTDVRRILGDLEAATHVHRSSEAARSVKVVSVESLAEIWLMPKLPDFEAAHPDIVVEIETHHRGVDPGGRDFDAWLAYAGPTAAPRPKARPDELELEEDTLFEEMLRPVCSPALIEARGRPRTPADLHAWPLLHDLGWEADWPLWCARQGVPAPDLSRSKGFRLYSMVVQAAVEGLGVTIGRPGVIARELADGRLVPLFEQEAGVPGRCCLVTHRAGYRSEVQAFRQWVLDEARQARQVSPPVTWSRVRDVGARVDRGSS